MSDPPLSSEVMTSEEPSTDLRSVTHLCVFQSSPDRLPQGYCSTRASGARKQQRNCPLGLVSCSPTFRALLHCSRHGRAEQWQCFLSHSATNASFTPKEDWWKVLKLEDELGLKGHKTKLCCCQLPSSTHPKGSRSSPPTANGPRGSHLKQTRDNYWKSQSSLAPGLPEVQSWCLGGHTRTPRHGGGEVPA